LLKLVGGIEFQENENIGFELVDLNTKIFPTATNVAISLINKTS
jgi:hypothetical protein